MEGEERYEPWVVKPRTTIYQPGSAITQIPTIISDVALSEYKLDDSGLRKIRLDRFRDKANVMLRRGTVSFMLDKEPKFWVNIKQIIPLYLGLDEDVIKKHLEQSIYSFGEQASLIRFDIENELVTLYTEGTYEGDELSRDELNVSRENIVDIVAYILMNGLDVYSI